MKTIRVPLVFRSFGAALAIAGLQFSSAVLPSAYAQAQDAKAQPSFFDWENLQTDVSGVADRKDKFLVNPWGLAINTNANVFWVSDNNAKLESPVQGRSRERSGILALSQTARFRRSAGFRVVPPTMARLITENRPRLVDCEQGFVWTK